MITSERICEFIENAEAGIPKELPPVEGFSSPKVRRLLNQLGSVSKKYLEIEVHVGSTFIPACYNNPHLSATAIDDWSMFGDVRPQFEKNATEYLTCDVKIIAADAFAVSLGEIAYPVDLYFYDGPHDFTSQYKAIRYFAPILADQCVVVVDDCNWEEPRRGTVKALAEIDFDVVWNCLLPARIERDVQEWWNGLLVMLLERHK